MFSFVKKTWLRQVFLRRRSQSYTRLNASICKMVLCAVGVFVLILPPLVQAAAPTAAYVAPLIESATGEHQEFRQLIFIMTDMLRESDMDSPLLPHLRQLAKNGAAGVMNVNAQRYSKQSAILTLANGGISGFRTTPLKLIPQDGVTAEGNRAKDEYRVRKGQILQEPVWCENCLSINQDNSFVSNAPIGLLGDVLRQHQIRRIAVGSEDLFLLVCDSTGEGTRMKQRVAYKKDPFFPGGLRLDQSQILYEIERQKAMGDNLFAIEWEDVSKLEQYKNKLAASQYENMRQKSLLSLDGLVERLLNKLDTSTLLMVASPRTDLHGKSKEMAPILIAGGNMQAGGLLTSATTKRQGIVSDLDVAPTILDFFQVNKPQVMVGRPIGKGMVTGKSVVGQSMVGQSVAASPGKTAVGHASVQGSDNLKLLHQIAIRTKATYSMRPIVMYVFASLVTAGLLLMVTGIWLTTRYKFRLAGKMRLLNKGLQALMWYGTAVLAAPLLFLLIPINAEGEVWKWSLEVMGALLVVTYGFIRIRNVFLRLAILGFLTVSSLTVDLVTGGHLITASVLSFDPIVGARYYGIGNEYMGLLVVWAMLGGGLVQVIRPARRVMQCALTGCTGLVLILLFASPVIGANAGGTVTAAATTAAAILFLCGFNKKIGWVLGLTFTGLAVVLLILVNSKGGAMTHISLAVELADHGRLGSFLYVVQRKVLMNFRLINDYAGKTLVLVLFTAIVTAVFYPPVWMKRFPQDWQKLLPFVKAGIVGALAGFAANDSGVVVAGMIVYPILYMVLMIMLAAMLPSLRKAAPNGLSHLDTPDFSPETEHGR